MKITTESIRSGKQKTKEKAIAAEAQKPQVVA
jgi:hypothetical protein